MNKGKPVKDLEDFTRRALTFDWYYAMSDDHRVWQAGEAERDALYAFKESCDVASDLWTTLCKSHMNDALAGQLMQFAADVALLDGCEKDSIASLQSFLFKHVTREQFNDSFLRGIILDAIAKTIPDIPKRWDSDRADKRSQMITNWIAEFTRRVC